MLKITEISFPGLFPNMVLEVDSVAFTLFGHAFPWYSLIITSGILFCFLYVTYRCKGIGISSDSVMDIGIVTVLMGIVGARVYYVATSWDMYKDDPLSAFAIWEGGIAIYGALIGGGIGVFLMCRAKKASFYAFADTVAPSLLFAQSLGRWGNFFNAEAYGSETDIFCRMGLKGRFDSDFTFYHPTFLYESLWNIIGFVIANALYKKKKYDFQITQFVFAWYGFGRMFIELLRTDSLYITSHHAWYTKISVLVGFGFFVGCTAILIRNYLRMKHGERLPLTAPATVGTNVVTLTHKRYGSRIRKHNTFPFRKDKL